MTMRVTNNTRLYSLAISITCFGLVGLALLSNSRATTSTATLEPELGVLSTGAKKVVDQPASGGSAVQFGPPLPQLGFSLSSDGMSTGGFQAQLNRLADIGAKWGRAGMYSWDTTRNDKIVNSATAAGLGTVITGTLPGDEWSGSKPVNVTGLADQMVALATRYKGKGPGDTNPVLELPNESNGRVDPAVYAQIACQTYPRVKAVDPTYKIIGASENVYVSDWQNWLAGVYQNGLRNCIDAISFHNYDDPSADANNKFGQLRATMTQYGDGDKPVWLTEFGASTCPGTIQPLGCYTEQGQSDKIVASIRNLQKNYPWIQVAMVYCDTDIPSLVSSNPKEAYFGIYKTDANNNVTGTKPAAAALKTLYGL